MRRSPLVLGCLALGLVGCSESTGPIPSRPLDVTYRLEPSGNPLVPAGLILSWTPVPDADLEVYNVYSRLAGSEQFDLRGSTTSATFHDEGPPDLEYFVTALNFNGLESEPSDVVLIDELLRLERPASIASTSLNGAIHLAWSDNAFETAPDGFDRYRVYSALFFLDDGVCDATWVVEGTTVAPEFLSSVLENGVPRCFSVSAISIEGWESLLSDAIADTPRPDARNVLVTRDGFDPDFSGFRFFLDANSNGAADAGELGIVTRGDRSDIDFWMFRNGSGDLVIDPVRPGTRVALYSSAPIDDLTSIDIAPVSGYSANGLTAEPGFGYVFEMDGGDGFLRFGAIRVTHVGPDYIIFDWSYQTDPGNPELLVRGGLPVGDGEPIVVGAK